MRNYPVPFEVWEIGMEFWLSDLQWMVTDVGKRTITAICVSGVEDPSWLAGPPYAVQEHVIDENDLSACSREIPFE